MVAPVTALVVTEQQKAVGLPRSDLPLGGAPGSGEGRPLERLHIRFTVDFVGASARVVRTATKAR